MINFKVMNRLLLLNNYVTVFVEGHGVHIAVEKEGSFVVGLGYFEYVFNLSDVRCFFKRNLPHVDLTHIDQLTVFKQPNSPATAFKQPTPNTGSPT